MKTIGLLTIGQSPRMDMTPEIKEILGKNINIIEKGALDGLTLDEIHELYPKEHDETLVTKTRDGISVKVADRHIVSRIQSKINEFEDEGIKVVFLACTGEFPSISGETLIIKPQEILYKMVEAIGGNLNLGILIPDENQMEIAKRKWKGLGKNLIIRVASPYEEMSQIKKASYEFKDMKADLVVMDCIGYNLEMKDMIYSITGKPVINARSLTANLIGDIM